jgi:NADPH-dependent glutamate synthase beta subunit-like oxidoreductase
MEQYIDCTLCRIEPRGLASRCRFCSGKLTGRDRLLWEIFNKGKVRKTGTVLSAFAAGMGQMFTNRWLTGVAFAVMIPLCLGLLYVTWGGFSYSHLFVVATAIFVLFVAALDVWLGPTEPEAPCQKSCPAQVPIPDYLQLIIDGNYTEGFDLIRTRMPLVAAIGRVCPHPCETSCFRGIDGEPISINGCKRFLSDSTLERELDPQTSPAADAPRVAVVGAGPGGLSCAYFLSILGARVTVYDAEAEPGGRFFTTIPDFRLPREVLRGEVDQLRRRGVIFENGVTLGPSGTGLAEVLEKNDALYLGTGAPKTIALDIEGAEALTDFQEFLRAAKGSEAPVVSGKVAIIGGGNAAIDVCRTALRCGADEVHLLYRRDRQQMPAREDEVEAAMREGVHFHYLVNPTRAVADSDGKLTGIEVTAMELSSLDSSGRPRPVRVEGSERVMEFSMAIPCLGQDVVSDLFDDPALSGIVRDANGQVVVNSHSQKTSLPKVYGGGDLVRGPATAVAAIADGRAAALAIYAEISPREIRSNRNRNLLVRQPFVGHIEQPQEKIREEMRSTPLRGRVDNFCEVEEGFYDGQALREAKRCLQCHREL